MATLPSSPPRAALRPSGDRPVLDAPTGIRRRTRSVAASTTNVPSDPEKSRRSRREGTVGAGPAALRPMRTPGPKDLPVRASNRRRNGGSPFGAFGVMFTRTVRPSSAKRPSTTTPNPAGSNGKGRTSILRTTFLVARSTSFTLWASCASPTRPATASSLPFGEKSRPPTSRLTCSGPPMRSRVRVSSRTTVPLSSPAASIRPPGLSASAKSGSPSPCITPIAAGRRTNAESK